MASRFGLYGMGWFLFLAAWFVADAVYAANKLGALISPVPINGWTTFGVGIALIIMEWVAILIEAAGRE